ncbi:DUF302 domain-containing protein [Salegentibacter sp. JZCK2]|uniref:DUF302 domain-containing protein n=1 Tax=Salegentibacter tibetensis TaxID=2873600 RepID=UPI001CC9D53C|nr:DUF302 domain-containing protein [Salegentibacter tibetensis]MBZ9728309.1 DUF302 domain-containing protein [Salegentibacter tibetensis]
MNTLLKFYVFIFFCGILNGFAQEKQNDHLMISESQYSFENTVSRLESLLKQNQALSIFTKIEHSENAKKTNLELAETSVLIFGNPKQGTLLMQCDQLAGIDLPLKMLIFNEDGQNIIAYNSINYLKKRYELKEAKNLSQINKGLQNIASKASGSKVKKSGKFKLNKHQGIISEISEFDFKTTYDRLVTAIEENPNLNIFAEIDHFENAEKAGMGLRPTRLIIFGNPKIGTPVMQENAKIALEFPVKFLVWRDEAGIVKISYNDPAFLAERFNLNKNIPQLETMKDVLENLSKNASKN